MKTKKKLFIIITIFLFVSMSIVIILNIVRSQTMYTTTTSTQYICPYSAVSYRSVVKSSVPHMMMPAGSTTEWTDFVNNHPSVSGLTVSTIGCCNDGHCTGGATCSSGSCVGGGECSGPRDCNLVWMACPYLMDCQGNFCCCTAESYLCLEEECPGVCFV